jgi:hypothetical protein
VKEGNVKQHATYRKLNSRLSLSGESIAEQNVHSCHEIFFAYKTNLVFAQACLALFSSVYIPTHTDKTEDSL